MHRNIHDGHITTTSPQSLLRLRVSSKAVQREVREEATVHVDAVEVLGTQPWPIGRRVENTFMNITVPITEVT